MLTSTRTCIMLLRVRPPTVDCVPHSTHSRPVVRTDGVHQPAALPGVALPGRRRQQPPLQRFPGALAARLCPPALPGPARYVRVVPCRVVVHTVRVVSC